MTEQEELEQYNQANATKLANRPVGNKLTCPNHCSRGYFYSTVCDPAIMRCPVCRGMGYITFSKDDLVSNINEFMRPLTNEERKLIYDASN